VILMMVVTISTSPVARGAPAGPFSLRVLVSSEVGGALLPLQADKRQCATSQQAGGIVLVNPCLCWGGLSRRLAVVQQARDKVTASNDSLVVLDAGGFFWGSGSTNYQLPRLGGIIHRASFAQTQYDGWGLIEQDFFLADRGEFFGGSTGLASWVYRQRSLDPTLPLPVVTNIDFTATADLHLNSSNLATYSIMDAGGGRRVALLALANPDIAWKQLTGFNRLLPYNQAIQIALVQLWGLPAHRKPHAVICLLSPVDTTYETAEQLARENIGLAAVVGYKVTDKSPPNANHTIVRNWAGDSVLLASRSRNALHSTGSGPETGVLQLDLNFHADGFDQTGRPGLANATSTWLPLNCGVVENASFSNAFLLANDTNASNPVLGVAPTTGVTSAKTAMLSFHSRLSAELARTIGSLAKPSTSHAQSIVPLDGRRRVVDACTQPTRVHDGQELCGCRVAECTAGNFVADAARQIAQADIGLVNSGSIRQSVGILSALFSQTSWAASQQSLVEVQPFLNQLHRIDGVPGTTLRQILQHSIAALGNGDAAAHPKGQFMQVSGLTFTWSYCGTRPVVRDVLVGGLPLEPLKLYSIASSGFITGGGDGYSMFTSAAMQGTGMVVSDRGMPMAMASVTYLERQSGVLLVELEKRIQQLPHYCEAPISNGTTTIITEDSDFPAWAIVVISVVGAAMLGIAVYLKVRLHLSRKSKNQRKQEIQRLKKDMEALQKTDDELSEVTKQVERAQAKQKELLRKRALMQQLPPTWNIDLTSPKGGADASFLVKLEATDAQYWDVHDQLCKDMPDAWISKCWRVQNSNLWNFFCFHKSRLDSENTKQVWHGTSDLDPATIYADEQDGFMMQYANPNGDFC
jgi:2',3'-cyclic-nucleotide 2'-phosphodiesterase (5'-nucleotidase family)